MNHLLPRLVALVAPFPRTPACRALAACAVAWLSAACGGGDGATRGDGESQLSDDATMDAAGDDTDAVLTDDGDSSTTAGVSNDAASNDALPDDTTTTDATPNADTTQDSDVSSVGIAGVVVAGECRPLCQTDSDPDGDGWGWENEDSCVVPGSEPDSGQDCTVGGAGTDANTTTSGDGDDGSSPPGDTAGDTGSGGDAGSANDDANDDPMLEPQDIAGEAERPAGNSSSGFFVANGRLYDAYGNDFVIRGINNPHVWFDTGGRYEAYDALDPIAALGTNTIRIVWETNFEGADVALLRQIIERIVELEMIPMVELHDVTGGESNDDLLRMADYYSRDDVKQVLVDYEEFLLVNIANEWSGRDWRGGYRAAIDQLRGNGINHTLVIDGNGYGQNADVILDDGAGLLEDDSQSNLLFSVHMYERYATQNGGNSLITQVFEGAVSRQLPLIVGEFGSQHGMPPASIDTDHISAECARLGLGYIAWSWKGNNSEVSYLDLAVDWQGEQLTDWGDSIINGPNGISATALTASIFLL